MTDICWCWCWYMTDICWYMLYMLMKHDENMSWKSEETSRSCTWPWHLVSGFGLLPWADLCGWARQALWHTNATMINNAWAWAERHNKLRKNEEHGEWEAKIIQNHSRWSIQVQWSRGFRLRAIHCYGCGGAMTKHCAHTICGQSTCISRYWWQPPKNIRN